MNSLLYALVVALRSHRWLRLLACAFIFTSLGNHGKIMNIPVNKGFPEPSKGTPDPSRTSLFCV